MLLGNLLKSIGKDYQKIPITGISFDSRKVRKNNIFFAITGNKTSGTRFVNEAISRGASVIVTGKKFKNKKKQIPLISVKDIRASLSEACSNFYIKKPVNIIEYREELDRLLNQAVERQLVTDVELGSYLCFIS